MRRSTCLGSSRASTAGSSLSPIGTRTLASGASMSTSPAAAAAAESPQPRVLLEGARRRRLPSRARGRRRHLSRPSVPERAGPDRAASAGRSRTSRAATTLSAGGSSAAGRRATRSARRRCSSTMRSIRVRHSCPFPRPIAVAWLLTSSRSGLISPDRARARTESLRRLPLLAHAGSDCRRGGALPRVQADGAAGADVPSRAGRAHEVARRGGDCRHGPDCQQLR
jgi:hypothetical protein